jgi:DNA polymerase-3 subunit epsilon
VAYSQGVLWEGSSNTKPDALFAVIDLETTGFSPLVGDRVIEVQSSRWLADGTRADEYVTLVNRSPMSEPLTSMASPSKM